MRSLVAAYAVVFLISVGCEKPPDTNILFRQYVVDEFKSTEVTKLTPLENTYIVRVDDNIWEVQVGYLYNGKNECKIISKTLLFGEYEESISYPENSNE